MLDKYMINYYKLELKHLKTLKNNRENYIKIREIEKKITELEEIDNV